MEIIRKMMKKEIIVGLVALSVLLAVFSLVLITRNIFFKNELSQMKLMMMKMKDEVKRIGAEKEKIAAKNEKLEADAVSYVSLSSDLQKQKDELLQQLNAAQSLLDAKEGDLQRMDQSVKEEIEEKKSEIAKVSEEKEALAKKLKSLEDRMRAEKAIFHYNLAVAYAKSKMYDEAIKEYVKSIELDDANADAHYNVAFLYKDYYNDTGKATMHFKRYIELKPKAEDREEVEFLIKGGRL